MSALRSRESPSTVASLCLKLSSQFSLLVSWSHSRICLQGPSLQCTVASLCLKLAFSVPPPHPIVQSGNFQSQFPIVNLKMSSVPSSLDPIVQTEYVCKDLHYGFTFLKTTYLPQLLLSWSHSSTEWAGAAYMQAVQRPNLILARLSFRDRQRRPNQIRKRIQKERENKW